jgi:hypothetical protein
MSLEYYLFYRKHYESVMINLDDIINSTLDPSSNEFDLIQANFLIQRKQHVTKLKAECDKKILELCKHEFEDDLIDITPDSSKNITYCKVCGYTK